MKRFFNILLTAIAMLFMIAIGSTCGFLISYALMSTQYQIYEKIFFIAGLLFAGYLSIILHEVGHLICGLISGYRFSSFRIAGLMWIKQDGKIKLCRHSIVGTGGQCLMLPPENNQENPPVVLYNLGGVIANVILTAVYSLCIYLLWGNHLICSVFIISAVLSLIIAITNGIPMNISGFANDGMNALHLSKDPVAARTFLAQLQMSAAQASGIRISDMPDEWFAIPENADMQNIHIASIAVFSASRALDRLDTLSAEKEIGSLLARNANIIGLHKNLLKCDLVFARLINKGKEAEISSLLTLEQLKFMKSMSSYPSILRTEYAIALIRDNDESTAEKIRSKFDKIAKKYPYTADIVAEREMLDYVFEVHKKQI